MKKTKTTIQFLFDVTGIVAPAEDGLTRIPIIRIGNWDKDGVGKFAITAKMVDQMRVNFNALKSQGLEIPFGYEHTQEFPEVAQGQPIPAAGWLKRLEDKPDSDGVVWGWAELTAKARQMISDKEYRYISPAFDFMGSDRRSGKSIGAELLSIALTNRPFLPMPSITLSEPCSAVADKSRLADKGEVMKQKKVQVTLDDEGTYTMSVAGKDYKIDMPAEAKSAWEEDQADGGADDDHEDASGKKKPAAMTGVIKQSSVITLDAYSKGSKSKDVLGDKFIPAVVLLERDTDALLSDLVKQGRILPKQTKFYRSQALSDLDSFKEFASTLTPQIDMKQRGLGAGEENPNEETEDLSFVKNHPLREISLSDLASSDKDGIAQYAKVLRLADARKCTYQEAFAQMK